MTPDNRASVKQGNESVYEYLTTRCHEDNDLDKHMNAMGAEGWRRYDGPRHSPNSGMWQIRWERRDVTPDNRAYNTSDATLERVWDENRADCPRWHTLTNSERYRLGVMFRAAYEEAVKNYAVEGRT